MATTTRAQAGPLLQLAISSHVRKKSEKQFGTGSTPSHAHVFPVLVHGETGHMLLMFETQMHGAALLATVAAGRVATLGVMGNKMC